MTGMKKVFALLVVLTVWTFAYPTVAIAQSVTAGDIQGVVSDSTGALIPNAKVTVKNAGNGETKSLSTSGNGSFRAALLTPGTYTVTIVAPGFSTSSTNVTVGAGNVTTDDVRLSIGQNGATVEVTAAAELVNTENANVETVFSAEQVQAMPNPGNDLTFVAQSAPGSVMNTGTSSGGYGNFSSFGISGVSNMFTLDGGYENDPFLNLNNTGASNLTLGNNEVDTVTVVSPAYSAQFGGLGGAQVNEITTSGQNRVHGNANYYWSGRVLNANDWFHKQSQVSLGEQNIPSFVNANQWSASIGGPIIRNKLFFFVNTEGLRVTTPDTGQVYVPSAAYEACSLTGTGCAALNALAAANCASNPSSTCVGAGSFGAFAQAPASQVPLLTSIFNTYNNSPYRPAASAISVDPNDVSAVSYFASSAAFLKEWLLMGRVDWAISDKDRFYVHYKQDKGTQPTYTDLISPLFTDASPQPAWEGQTSEIHNFTNNFVNQLVVTGNYYSAPFQNSNNYKPVAPFTFAFIDGDLANSTYGGIDYAFPQGRRVAGYQVIDDISYSKGRNSLHFGYNIRRDNISDITESESSAGATLDVGSVETFGQGQTGYYHQQNFPEATEQRVGVYNMGAYVEDAYKVMPNLTVTAGLRVERNSNPTCHDNCLQTLAFGVNSLPTGTASTNSPYSAAFPGGLIASNRYRAFTGYQKVGIMPRISFAYQPFGTAGNTVIRAGFGMFTDTFPGQIADLLLNNAPVNFGVTVYGSDAGNPAVNLDPTTAGSAAAVAVASNNAFHTLYASGGTYNTISTAVGNAGGAYSSPNFTTTAPHIYYPTYEEFNVAIEQKIGRKSSVAATYVGNHGYHEPVGDSSRNLTVSTSNAGFFPTVPTATPVVPFSTITNYYSGAVSNFNGVVVTGKRQSKTLTMIVNYQYSKALDEISNGGFNAYAPNTNSELVSDPNSLRAQYGLADYNVKHNTTGSLVYDVPSYHRFKEITGGFEFNAVFFHQSGLPYTITNSTTDIDVAGDGFTNGSVNLFAHELNNNFDHHCGSGAHALAADGSNPHPCNFKASFATPTNFDQQGRNSLIGPSYTNVDFGAFKVIAIPHAEFVKLKLGAQFFNLFNHPNFAAPNGALAGSIPSTFGAISSTVSSPTNIFGSVGANSSPRLIQLKANLTF
jgi:hypothetical protein